MNQRIAVVQKDIYLRDISESNLLTSPDFVMFEKGDILIHNNGRWHKPNENHYTPFLEGFMQEWTPKEREMTVAVSILTELDGNRIHNQFAFRDADEGEEKFQALITQMLNDHDVEYDENDVNSRWDAWERLRNDIDTDYYIERFRFTIQIP
jgi:hypothetical protein